MGGEHRLEVIRATLMSYEPATKTQEQVQNELLRYLDAMMIAREQRLAAVTASIPPVLWYVVFHRRFPNDRISVDAPHGAGIADHSRWDHCVFPGIMIFLIYAMDRPL
jgi:hypothetical protein